MTVFVSRNDDKVVNVCKTHSLMFLVTPVINTQKRVDAFFKPNIVLKGQYIASRVVMLACSTAKGCCFE